MNGIAQLADVELVRLHKEQIDEHWRMSVLWWDKATDSPKVFDDDLSARISANLDNAGMVYNEITRRHCKAGWR